MEDKTEMYKPGAQTVESPEQVLFANSLLESGSTFFTV